MDENEEKQYSLCDMAREFHVHNITTTLGLPETDETHSKLMTFVLQSCEKKIRCSTCARDGKVARVSNTVVNLAMDQDMDQARKVLGPKNPVVSIMEHAIGNKAFVERRD